jgi:uncharacterized protein YjiS (DUF1127 family)
MKKFFKKLLKNIEISRQRSANRLILNSLTKEQLADIGICPAKLSMGSKGHPWRTQG